VKNEQKVEKTGRGNFFTFLSPTTVTNIIQTICKLLLLKISEEVNSAGIYSITIDTTMDISTHDQCVFVLRYIEDRTEGTRSIVEVKQRVVALKNVISSSGQGLFDLLKLTLDSMNIGLDNCVADAFDGAANMNGQYKGVQAKLKEVLPRHIHTWCHAHVLNLVLQQTTSCSVTVISFFGLFKNYLFFSKNLIKDSMFMKIRIIPVVRHI